MSKTRQFRKGSIVGFVNPKEGEDDVGLVQEVEGREYWILPSDPRYGAICVREELLMGEPKLDVEEKIRYE